MKKGFLIAALVMTAAAIGFVIAALNHPELSFPLPLGTLHSLYGIYVSVTVLMYVLAFAKSFPPPLIASLIFQLLAVYFLTRSMLYVSQANKNNWFLIAALSLNLLASLINIIAQKRAKRTAKE